MESMDILTKNAAETKKLGEKLAREIILSHFGSRTSKGAMVISLEGELGAGKTTFAQGFAKGLGIKENPRSPTFVIMQIYKKHFIHIDAYRLEAKDFKALNWKDFVSDKKNIILVEWGNKIKTILPKDVIRIKFQHKGHINERMIEIL